MVFTSTFHTGKPLPCGSLLLIALAALGLGMPGAKAALVEMSVRGMVTANSTFLGGAKVGTPWEMTMAYDSDWPDFAPADSAGVYNGSIRSFNFSIGTDYSLHSLFVAIDITNQSSAKTLILDLFYNSALGSIGGQTVRKFFLSCKDITAGYSDGTDFWGENPGITEASFSEGFDCYLEGNGGDQDRIKLGVDALNFATVPEPTTAELIGLAVVLAASLTRRKRSRVPN